MKTYQVTAITWDVSIPKLIHKTLRGREIRHHKDVDALYKYADNLIFWLLIRGEESISAGQITLWEQTKMGNWVEVKR